AGFPSCARSAEPQSSSPRFSSRSLSRSEGHSFLRHHRALDTESRAQHVTSIDEDALDVRPHQPPVDKEIEWHRVTDAIAHERSAVTLLKTVLVNPLAIRAANLLVDKANGRFPDGYLCAPVHWKSAQ